MRRSTVVLVALLTACAGSSSITGGPSPKSGVGPFLGSGDFAGDWIDPPGPVVSGVQSTFNGALTVSNVDRAEVVPLLPFGFKLADRTTTDAKDQHPVLLVFGDQTDGAIVNPFFVTPLGTHYSEMILAVPFVQRIGRSGWYTMIVRMYLDNDAAVTAGLAYGYQKEKAWLTWLGDDAAIEKTAGGSLLEGAFSWGEPWQDAPAALSSIPNFQDLVDMMTTRLLGRTGMLPICSHFEWDLSEAMVVQAGTSYDMIDEFTSAMAKWPAMSPFTNVVDGAVVVRGIRWRLSNLPIVC